MTVVAAACNTDRPSAPRPGSSAPASTQRFEVALAGDPGTPEFSEFRSGAELAASEITEAGSIGAPLIVSSAGPATPATVGRVTTGLQYLALLTVGGSDGLRAAASAIEEAMFCAIELHHDLYESGLIGPSVFQVPTPHNWQAWRLARYFGPGDRDYSKVGLIRQPGGQGDVAAATLKQRLSERGVDMTEVALPAAESVAAMERERPQAVVVEGSDGFRGEVFTLLSQSHRYEGRGRINEGWRPQPAGFESVVASGTGPPGGVFAADYAIPWSSGQTVVGHDALTNVAEQFRKQNERLPKLRELQGYEAVRLVAEAAKRAGLGPGKTLDVADRKALIAAMESFDRVRFARLPISLGPTDHVIAERDHQGLWSTEPSGEASAPLAPLMRAFTSDLERTNVLEEDWSAYFEGAMPGGEAPFFHQSRFGITTPRSDDFR